MSGQDRTDRATLSDPMCRARAATARAEELRARAERAAAEAVTVVTNLVADHGDRLRPVGGRRGVAEAPASVSTVFTLAGLSAARLLITRAAGRAGLSGEALSDFVLAVQELMANAVRHGRGWGRVVLRHDDDRLICSTHDFGPGLPAVIPAGEGLPAVRAESGRGLFLARHLTDSLQMRRRPIGAIVTVTVRLPATPAPAHDSVRPHP